MCWREISITVSSEGEEAVADLFYQLGCSGVSVEDPELLAKYIASGVWDYHAFGNVESLGFSVIKGYFPENEELEEKQRLLDSGISELLKLSPGLLVKTTGLTTLMEEDWENAWKIYFKPFRIGERFLIKPSWEEAEVQEGDIVLELDPGMAFGTGTHPTTALCLRALEQVVKPGRRVFDLGTGSGILAIAAAKLGAMVEAVDLDAVAVKVAGKNVKLNQVEDRVRVRRGDLGAGLEGQADVVVANIIADVILNILGDLRRVLSPQGDFLAGGIIDNRAEEVAAAMREAGLEIVGCTDDSGWVQLWGRWVKSAPF